MENKRTYLALIVIVLLSLLPLRDMFRPGLPVTHDGQDHVARIANFYQNLAEGVIIPRWAANLNWGYGHPILMFLYPLPSYIVSLIHVLGFTFVDSFKLLFGLTFVFSGLGMYFWVRNFLDDNAGMLAAMLYMFAPYRFVDMYVRGAVGEHVAFIFPPFICYFLLKLSKKHSFLYIIGGSLSLAGIVLSHNAMTLMFLPILLLYAIHIISVHKNKLLLLCQYISILVLGFGLSAFFWLPAFYEGKYTLREIVTKGTYKSSFVEFGNFFYSPWSYGGTGQLSVQVGLLQWLLVFFCLFLLIKLYLKKINDFFILFISILIFFLSLFIMTKSSDFIWQTVTIIQKFQFPWRFLSVTVFSTSIIGGFSLYLAPKKFRLILLVVLVSLLLLLNKDYWYAKGFLFKNDQFYTSIYDSTTDTGESSPIWSVRFMEKRPKARIEVIYGDSAIKEIKRTTTHHIYEVNVLKNSRIKENTLYFPGWNVLIDGKPVDIEFQDPAHRGLMTFFVSEGVHTLDVKFSETKLRYLANYISFASIVGIIGHWIINHYQLWKRSQ